MLGKNLYIGQKVVFIDWRANIKFAAHPSIRLTYGEIYTIRGIYADPPENDTDREVAVTLVEVTNDKHPERGVEYKYGGGMFRPAVDWLNEATQYLKEDEDERPKAHT